MNKENCALKLVDEIILYYDAQSKKHQILIMCLHAALYALHNAIADASEELPRIIWWLLLEVRHYCCPWGIERPVLVVCTFGIVVSLPINSETFNLEVWSSWPVFALHRIWQIGSTLKTLKGHSTWVYLPCCHLLSIRSLSPIKCVCTFA